MSSEHVEVLERLRGVLEHGKMGDKCLIAPDLVTAAIAALSAPQPPAEAQAGEWVLVPREPTPEMLEKGGVWNTEMDTPPEHEVLHCIWRDMLAAAPQPPAEAQRCTCPSGDGSLRWPCPVHPPSAPAGVEGLLADLETIWHSVSDDKEANAAYERLKIAIAQQPAAPSGETGGDWVTVPRVPTDAMLDAMHGRIQILCDPAERTADIQNDAEVWGAMLTAAPQQPAAVDEAMVERINQRFTSGNSVQVERAHITAEEWQALSVALAAKQGGES